MSRIYKRMNLDYYSCKFKKENILDILEKYEKKDFKISILCDILNYSSIKISKPDFIIRNDEIYKEYVFSIDYYNSAYLNEQDFLKYVGKENVEKHKISISLIGFLNDYVYSVQQHPFINNFPSRINDDKLDYDLSIKQYNIYKYKIDSIEILKRDVYYYTKNIYKTVIDIMDKNIDYDNLKFEKICSSKKYILFLKEPSIKNTGGKKFNYKDSYSDVLFNYKYSFSNKIQDMIDVCRLHYINTTLVL